MTETASSPSQEPRRLAAVLFTDVVGYSARMQRDERDTIGRVKDDFNRMREACAAHGGEILNTMGDGMLMCFTSVVEAVACALDIQRGFNERKARDETAIEHRIGVHLGDVFRSDEGQVVGDGVNIAARLESKAPTGGVCVSQSVYDAVKGKIAMQARFAGALELKNIGSPLPAWHLMPEGIDWPAAAPAKREAAQEAVARKRWMVPAMAAAVALLVLAGAAALWFAQRGAGDAVAQDTSIAVLPFANMSDDRDAGYFADGIHEDLLTQLATVGALKVVSRTSVMEYRNTAKKIRDIGSELHVAYLVEGSVRRVKDQVRVTAQLINAKTDQHVWAKNYDRSLADIFAIQSELSKAIADELKLSLTAPQAAQLAQKPTVNPAAYDEWLRYQERYNKDLGTNRGFGAVLDRIALLEKAVALDDKFALAWARLAGEHARAYHYGIDNTPKRQELAKQAMERALALAPQNIEVQIAEGQYYFYAFDDLARAAQSLESVLRAAPNNVAALSSLDSVRRREGRWDEVVKLEEQILAIDARNVSALNGLANTQSRFRHHADAEATLRRLIEVKPGELEFIAKSYWYHYLRTGDWGGYETWRASLPQDTADQVFWIRDNDTRRALQRRDFDTWLRLWEQHWSRSKLNAESVDLLIAFNRAEAYQAKGDTVKAKESARRVLQIVERWRATGRSASELSEQAINLAFAHAILGDRAAAFAQREEAMNQARIARDELAMEDADGLAVVLDSITGNKESAFKELDRIIKLPGYLPRDLESDPTLAALWDDPRFKAMVADPANNAPIPYSVKDERFKL